MDRIHVDLDKPWLTVADICDYMDVSPFVVTQTPCHDIGTSSGKVEDDTE